MRNSALRPRYSVVSETYGGQEGSACDGHFGWACHHPLFCLNHFGDLEGRMLGEGNVRSAKDRKSGHRWPA